MKWALRLNKQGHIDQAQLIKEDLSVMAKIAAGMWDAVVERGIRRATGVCLLL